MYKHLIHREAIMDIMWLCFCLKHTLSLWLQNFKMYDWISEPCIDWNNCYSFCNTFIILIDYSPCFHSFWLCLVYMHRVLYFILQLWRSVVTLKLKVKKTKVHDVWHGVPHESSLCAYSLYYHYTGFWDLY